MKRFACPGGKHSALNPACCVFFALSDELQTNKFDSQCAEDGKYSFTTLNFLTLNRNVTLQLMRPSA